MIAKSATPNMLTEDPWLPPTWDSRLLCCVKNLAYNFHIRHGDIWLPADECCDMDACVSLFTGIDPRVRSIQTYVGDEVDRAYVLRSTGWIERILRGTEWVTL